ncbi:hypothetical protein JOB18_019160 [Solea senegalensis]|uniref:Uncharacterized protein n=1 Tax=Solea senegalensis TaxID=28829 RepID=A0AAV6T5U6_SOLSE|nr:hypothetical protein JOB18_019160 [Solea senegalensis]
MSGHGLEEVTGDEEREQGPGSWKTGNEKMKANEAPSHTWARADVDPLCPDEQQTRLCSIDSAQSVYVKKRRLGRELYANVAATASRAAEESLYSPNNTAPTM